MFSVIRVELVCLPDIVTVLVGSYHRGHKCIGTGIFVNVRRVHLLRKLWLFVVFVFRVNPYGGCSCLWRFPCNTHKMHSRTVRCCHIRHCYLFYIIKIITIIITTIQCGQQSSIAVSYINAVSLINKIMSAPGTNLYYIEMEYKGD